MRFPLTQRVALYCAFVVAMIYVFDLFSGRNPWTVQEEGISALLGVILAVVLIPIFLVVDLIRGRRNPPR